MRKLSLALLCALALAACVSPPEDIDRVPDFDPAETLMGQIQQRGELRVGVPQDGWPPFWSDPEGGPLTGAGFIVALSNEIGEALGVDVDFMPMSEDYMLLTTDRGVSRGVDIVFPPVPATEGRAKAHPFTHPYWVAHQRLLVRSDSGIESPSDIEGDYCSILDEETGLDLLDVTGTAGTSSDIEGCARMLESGKVEAVTAPDMMLMSVWAVISDCDGSCDPSPDYAIVGDDLTTAGYSAVLPFGSPGWTSFVNATWGEAEAEGRWLEYYEEWIAPFGIELEEAPDMTIEEAAGLFPSSSEG